MNMLQVTLISMLALLSLDASARANLVPAYRLKVGDSVTLPALSSNPSTGYSWQVKIIESAEKLLDPAVQNIIAVSNVYKPSQENKPGAPGSELITVKGLKQGKVNIRLQYMRVWDPSSVTDSKDIAFTVEK